MNITKEERAFMRQLASGEEYPGIPNLQNAVRRLLDALEAAEAELDVLADIAAHIVNEMGNDCIDICPAYGKTCPKQIHTCKGCEYRDVEEDECVRDDDTPCPIRNKCAPNLLEYAQQKGMQRARAAS